MTYRVLDLFSGIGGFSLGLERTGGFKTVAFCEIDPFCRRVLAKHWPEVPCYDDVRTLTAERLAADGIGVDVICGGFPCQDISSAGKGAGLAGERSGLWSEITRLIGEIRPSYVIVENVAALLFRGMGAVLGDLAGLRYDAEWRNIPASAIGAPHQRERVWIVAYPHKGVRSPNVLLRCKPDKDVYQGFKRVRALQRAGSNGHRPPCNFTRIRPDDGISPRLDEIAALGNAVVPQIPEMIGRAILEANP
ncbi:MAG: DNA cytosine methyltransferase [Clostridia bacterium]|nr:DNA cytosine methyltransferase [Clostridia bacterium]